MSPVKRSATRAAPALFESEQETGLSFWRTGLDGDAEVQHSNRPHELLPHYCKVHRWYTDKPCPSHATSVPTPGRGRPRLVSTEQVVHALDTSTSLRQAADKLGVWHGAITMRKDAEILVARARMRGRRRPA